MHVQQTFAFADPHVDDGLARIDSLVAELSALGFHGDPRVDLTRTRRGTVDETNPATQRLHAMIAGLDAWLSLMPTAAALDPLYDPTCSALPSGAPISESMRPWLRNVADARGIRSRAAAFQQVADAHAREHTAGRWLSLACGAAHPVMRSLSALGRDGIRPFVDLVDLDPGSLRLAAEHARRAGVEGQVSTYRMNVLGRDGVAPITWLHRIRTPLRPGYDLVEAIGLLEYLRPDDWPYRYNKVAAFPRMLAGAITFLRNAWSMVAPGGLLVVSNMLDSHPQLGFTLNVIQWPHIQPRSVAAVLEMMAVAGLPPTADVVLPEDGVYAVYCIRKPG